VDVERCVAVEVMVELDFQAELRVVEMCDSIHTADKALFDLK
jgi:hypothetical protein